MARSLWLIAILGLPGVALAAGYGTPDPESLDPGQVIERTNSMPARGITMEAVRAELGSPDRRVSAVGDPPITRWVYPGQIIYFEHDRVIHAVKRDRR